MTSGLSSGGFRGGDGGDASPPTSLKVTISAEKSASIWNNSAPFGDASPPTSLNLTISAEKSLSISIKIFFFFFWRPSDFGRKKPSNLRFRPKTQSQNRRRPFFFFFFWRPPDFGRKKPLKSAENSVSKSAKTSEFLRFCA